MNVRVSRKSVLSSKDGKAVSELYNRWPYDRYRHHRLLSSSERQCLFERTLFFDKENDVDFYFLEEFGDVRAVIRVGTLLWDSEHFNLRMLNASVIYDCSMSLEILTEFVEEVLGDLNSRYESFHLSIQVDSDDYDLFNAVVSNGFLLFDQKRIFVARNKNNRGWRTILPVRQFKEEDANRVFSILENVNFPTRFSRDPALEPKKVDLMYRLWTESLMRPSSNREPVLVVEKDNQVVAFAAGQDIDAVHQVSGKRLCGGSLYFSDGTGVGGYVSTIQWLLENAMQNYDALELVVSSGNLPAIRVLESCGLMPATSQFSLHYHRNLS